MMSFIQMVSQQHEDTKSYSVQSEIEKELEYLTKEIKAIEGEE